jgi:hypothetical protein
MLYFQRQSWYGEGITTRDNCLSSRSPKSYFNTTIDSTCHGTYTLLREITIIDGCGNSVKRTQRVTVVDTIAPVLSQAPANITVSCDAVPAAAVLTATDNCNASPTIEFKETRKDGMCPGNYVLTRTWRASDGCNTSAIQTQVITVIDDKAPVLSASPADVTVNCESVPQASILTATDNCSPAPTVTYKEVRTTGSCTGNYILTRTWSATDACNNTSTKIQIITVGDTKPLALLCAPAVSHCYNSTPNYQYIIPFATASNNCSGNLAYSYVITGATQRSGSSNNASGTFNWGTSLIEWTVTDECGNVARCSTSVSINWESIMHVPNVKATSKGTVANTLYVGYAPASTLTYTVENLPGYTYSWKVTGNVTVVGSSSGNIVKVIYAQPSNEDGTLTLLVTNTSGCTQSITLDINVVDVRGGNKKDKVVICRNGNSLTVDEQAVPAHIAQGGYLAACGTTPIIDGTAPRINVYPNPSAGEFNVQLDNYRSSQATISIINEKGHLISVRSIQLNGKGTAFHFNLNGYPKGLYIVKVETKDGLQTSKILVQ